MGVRLEGLADGEAVHDGHEDIEEDEVGLAIVDEGEGAGSAIGGEDLVAGLGQMTGEDLEVLGEIIDDEDQFLGGDRRLKGGIQCERLG